MKNYIKVFLSKSTLFNIGLRKKSKEKSKHKQIIKRSEIFDQREFRQQLKAKKENKNKMMKGLKFMKKLLSTILAMSMVLTSVVNVFAAESKAAGNYNSLKIPVVNEVRNADEEKQDVFSTMLMSVGDEQPQPHSGGGGGGGTSGSTSRPGNPTEPKKEYTLVATGIPKQSAKKGDVLTVADYTTYFEDSITETGEFEKDSTGTVIEFQKDGNSRLLYVEEAMNFATADLKLPVPQELENGTYNVVFHRLGSAYDVLRYEDGEYAEVAIKFELEVNDADPANENPCTFNKKGELKNEPFNMFGRENYYGILAATFAMESPVIDEKFDSRGGFAIDQNGCFWGLNAWSYGGAFECKCNFYPAGQYDCYFYTNTWQFEENPEYLDVLYGPGTLNIYSVAFADQYYTASNNVWTEIYFGNSAAEKLPDGIEKEECTLSVDFKDKDGKSIHAMDEIAIDGLYIYDACLYTYFNFVGFEPGTYYADITLNDSEGTAYELGTALLNITDKSIINNVNILNYGNQLSSSTKYFYVELDMNKIFLDYDKININLLKNGDVVAKTVSKELRDSQTLLYKLNVTGTLENGWDVDYELDIQSDPSIELVSEAKDVYISVTTSPRVIRAELLGNTVKIYTENLLPGEYIVTESYAGTKTYNITIDEQGIGSFQPENIGNSTYISYDLRQLNQSYIDWFDVRVDVQTRNFSCNPGFISPSMTQIDDFYVEPKCMLDNPKVSDIVYARILQNGEEIAKMSDFKMDNWSYYYREAGVRPYITGKLTPTGKTMSVGKATFEIKYSDGYIYSAEIPVVDSTTKLFGNVNLENSCYYYGNDLFYAVGSNKVSFVIENTNITDGFTVKLLNDDQQDPIETLNVSDLTKTTKYGYYNTFKGTFTTELKPNERYYIVVDIVVDNSEFFEISSGGFGYYPGKLAYCYGDESAQNGTMDIALQDWLNVSDIKKVTFKALIGGKEYNIPVTTRSYYDDKDYRYFEANTSSLPVGYFTLKAYDGSTEIKLTESTVRYNFGNTSEIVTSGASWSTDKNKVRTFGVYGANLDKVKDAIVKIYKYVDFSDASNDYYPTKLKWIKDISAAKPYTKTRITINNDDLADLESGSYTFIYVLDGKAFEEQKVYIKGNEPAYKAEVVLNSGIAYTNKETVEMQISVNGYTQMKYAFSEADLEGASYESPVPSLKTISLAGKTGLVTVFVQFANDDASKTETVQTSITVDMVPPEINDPSIPEIGLWNNGEISFKTNEPLRNGFVVITDAEGEKRTYVAALESSEGGVYKYKCNLYADSWYAGKDNLSLQISAIDFAGNKTDAAETQLNIVQPRNISGTVTYLGNPVSNCTVYLESSGSTYYCAYTDSYGKYTFSNIPSGNYTVSINRYGFEKCSLNVTEEEFAADITDKDFTLESIYKNNSTISVTVVDSVGNAVKDAYVSAYSYDANVNINAFTDEDGKAALNVPYSDRGTDFRIYVTSSDYSKSQYVTVDAESKEITVTLPKKAEIKGIVKNGEDVVKNTQVVIEGSGYTTYAITDEEGKFTATVYLSEDKTFAVRVNGTSLSGMETVTFGDEETSKEITLNVSQNIRVKGTLKDKAGNAVSDFRSIYFSGNGVYVTVTLDEDGNFETPDLFGPGKYTVSACSQWNYGGYAYEDINTSFEIKEEDMGSPAYELNLTAESKKDALFATGSNGISATVATAAKGDHVTVSVKFQNDGTKSLSNVTAYAEIPDGLDVKTTSGTKSEDGKQVSKTVETLKADETGAFTFTLGTEAFEDTAIVIPAYVKVGNKVYNLGVVTVRMVSVSLDAPKVVKKDTAFKVSGESISGSTVEISNYDTKEVLATTDLVSRWYAVEITGLSADAKLIAKVTTKDGKVAYSEPVAVTVEETPVEFVDAKVSWGWNLSEYGANVDYGYPTVSVWDGYTFTIKAKFNNISPDATVKYSFNGKNNITSTKGADDYFSATISNWSGYGTKKIYATVTDGEKEYTFVVAEILVLVDPSGFITDAETGKPIVGATVLLEVKSGEDWIAWDATPHLQENPMITDENGYYGWMVPEGEYRIIVTAEGYNTKIVEEYNSRDFGDNSKITVLPMRTDVDIQLVYSHNIEINRSKTQSVAGKIRFVFTRPADPQTVTSENFKVLDNAGNEVKGTVILAENNTVVLFKPEIAMASGAYTLAVKDIKDSTGHTITAEEIPFAKQTDIAAISAPTVSYQSADGTIKIEFAEGTELANKEAILVKNGAATVSGTLRETGNILVFVPDNALTAGTTYNVIVSEALRTTDYRYLADDYSVQVKIPGGSDPGHSTGGGGGGAATEPTPFTVTVDKMSNGQVTTDLSKAKKGETVTITVTADQGFALDTLKVKDNLGKEIELKDLGNGKYSFTMPERPVKIQATFKEGNAEIKNGFVDVKADAYYYDAVLWAATNGVTTGTDDVHFAPEASCTRAQTVTFLWRAAGSPEPKSATNPFADVKADAYYYKAVLWAIEQGITNGVSETSFAPEETVDRSQVVTFLFRNAKAAAVQAAAQFTDVDSNAYYADAVAWAVSNEITNGTSATTFSPVDDCTRAQIVTFLYRFFVK